MCRGNIVNVDWGFSIVLAYAKKRVIPPREMKTPLLYLTLLWEWYLNCSLDNVTHLTAWGLARQPACRSHEASWGSHRGCLRDAPLGALPPPLRWCSHTGGCSRWCCGRALHPDTITEAKQKSGFRVVLLQQKAAVRTGRVGGRSRPHGWQKHWFRTICSD